MTHLVHIPMNPRDFGRWSARRGFRDNDAALHALVTGLFGRAVFQPFRFFETEGGCSIYGYSEHDEDVLRALMEVTMTPDMPVFPEDLRSKPMPELEANARVGFDMRVTPMRRRGAVERDAHDVEVLNGIQRNREESYLKWLSERLAGVADIEDFRLVRFRKTQGSRKGVKVHLSDATFHGTVSVKDRAGFLDLLKNGVGRGKAYGFGMVLLRPADPIAM